MRFNGWQRLGIVASVLWASYGAWYGAELADGQFGWEYSAILAAFYAFVPIVVGWIAAWAAYETVRWVWRGFFPLR